MPSTFRLESNYPKLDSNYSKGYFSIIDLGLAPSVPWQQRTLLEKCASYGPCALMSLSFLLKRSPCLWGLFSARVCCHYNPQRSCFVNTSLVKVHPKRNGVVVWVVHRGKGDCLFIKWRDRRLKNSRNVYLLAVLLLPRPQRCSWTASYSSGYLFILEWCRIWMWLQPTSY